jgi:hypothetical protein
MTHVKIKEYIITHRPPAAYLGRLEMKAFTDEANRDGYFVKNVTCEPDLHRLEYAGCPLFQVDSESHAGFGQNVDVLALAGDNTPNL